MKNAQPYLSLLMVALLLFSCSLQKGYVKFSDVKKDEIIATDAIKRHIKNNPNTSIVIKAPISETKSTQADQNSNVYNAIEKELLLAGFDVKDRGLFNEIVNKSKEIDYNELKRITGTDLILELIKVDTEVEYTTNKYYQKGDVEAIAEVESFTKYGASIEFKLTLIEGNMHGGSYLFHYTPCKEKTNDCSCEVAYKKAMNKVYPYLSFCKDPANQQTEGFEYISNDILSDFVRDGVRKMIKEIRS